MSGISQQLDDLASELREATSQPPADYPVYLSQLLARARALPLDAEPSRASKLLTDIAAQFYLHGAKVPQGLEPVTLAVVLAEQRGRKAELRRALSLQGLILATMRNTGSALRSLFRALSLAEELGERHGAISAWVNMGVVHYDCTLYSDSLACYSKGLALAEHAGEVTSEKIRALLGMANSYLQLTAIDEGIAACDRGLALNALVAPNPESEQVASLFEAIYARLLLEANRPRDALVRVVRAVDHADRCGSHRAMAYATLVRGLVDVYLGDVAQGVARIQAARAQTSVVPSSHVEAIRVAIMAYERAGRPDAALTGYRELMTEVAKSRVEASTWPTTYTAAGERHAGHRSDAAAYDSLAARVQLLLKLLPVPTAR